MIWRGSRAHLAWVQEALRVQRALDGAHHLYGHRPMLLVEEWQLPVAHAVLTTAGASHGDRPSRKPCSKVLRHLDLMLVSDINGKAHVEVAVAYMPEHRAHQTCLLEIFLGLQNAIREARDGHACVGWHALAPWPQRDGSVVRVMPCLPQLASLLGGGRPLEPRAPELCHQVPHLLSLLCHCRARSVELEEEGGNHSQVHLAVLVHRVTRRTVQQLHSRHRDPALDDGDGGIDGAVQALELTHRRGDRLRLAVESDGDFGDDAKRAFRPDEQPCQVVACGALARSPSRPHDASVSEHRSYPQNVVPHCPIADRVGS
mmetsp:Transcript_36714/g.75269  ORF Transcript_36714/g.75269 Transcript_36714/m.75269 type:complete len:316 (+) Transcript_36714:159-1106(+)